MARSAAKTRWVTDIFTECAPYYDGLQRYFTLGQDERLRTKAARLLKNPEGNLLEMCCGTGGFTQTLRRLYPDLRITAVDHCEEMLQIARKKMAGERGVHFTGGNAESLSFTDHSFNFVAMAFGLRHVSDSRTVLEEAFRLLKNGGQLVVLDIVSSGYRMPCDLFYHTYHHLFYPFACKKVLRADCSYQYLYDSILHFPSPRKIKRLMEDVGFDNVHWKRAGFGLAVIWTAWKG